MLNGFPVFDRMPDFSQDPVGNSIPTSESSTLGLRSFVEFLGRPLMNFTHVHRFDDVDKVEELLTFFTDRHGASGSFWVPTWHPDLAPVSDIAAGDSTLTIEAIGFDSAYQNSKNEPGSFLHIFNEATGTAWTPQVTSSEVIEGNEVLTLDTQATEGFSKSSTVVSLLILARLEDELDIQWQAPQIGEVTLNFTQSRDFLASESVDTFQDPPFFETPLRQLRTNGRVNDTEAFGDLLYIVGDFTEAQVIEFVAGNWVVTETNPRHGAACFDMVKGVWTPWAPEIPGDYGRNIAIKPDGSWIFIYFPEAPWLRAYDTNGNQVPGFLPSLVDTNHHVYINKLYYTGGRLVVRTGKVPSNETPIPRLLEVDNDGYSRIYPFHIIDDTGKSQKIGQTINLLAPTLTSSRTISGPFETFPESGRDWLLDARDGFIYFSTETERWVEPFTRTYFKHKGGIHRIEVDTGNLTPVKDWGTWPGLPSYNWYPRRPDLSYADSESGRLMVYAGFENGNWVMRLLDGTIPSGFYDQFKDSQISGVGGIGNVSGFQVVKSFLLLSVKDVAISGIIADRYTGVRIAEYGQRFKLAQGGSFNLAPGGKALWVCGSEVFKSDTNIHKTLPGDGRIVNVEDLS